MKVVVLAGGRSSERDVSLSTGAVIRDGLIAGGHDVTLVRVERSGAWLCNGGRLTLSPGEGLLGCDVVFPALHGPFGEDGTVQGLLELLDVPYVGAGVFASSLSMDKVAFKAVLAANDMPHVRYVAVPEQRWRSEPAVALGEIDALGMPVFVKPARLGSSVGIGKVTRKSLLRTALETAYSHDGVAVVEQYCPGVEVECAVIGLGDPVTSVPGQIVLRDADWYDYDAKYSQGGYTLAAPAPISDEVAGHVRRLARETFVRVGCTGLARVDFFVDGDRVVVNEINTMPGFTPTSDFPKLWGASGLALPALCDRLLELALERFRLERAGHSF